MSEVLLGKHVFSVLHYTKTHYCVTASLAIVRGLSKRQDVSVFQYKEFGQMGEWLKPGDCKSPSSGYVGSNPTLSTKNMWYVRNNDCARMKVGSN
jgi:hypothetical protein